MIFSAMSADPIVYCLEHLTDYRQFKRLCSDVMAGSGYPNIEPIGGSNDRGRDALHRNSDGLTIFAYTVRPDWRRKLQQDCTRVKEENHAPTSLVFVCTSTLSGHDKDEQKAFVRQHFGWTLEVYNKVFAAQLGLCHRRGTLPGPKVGVPVGRGASKPPFSGV